MSPEATPDIALALGAGGLRGLALAAVLRRLRRESVPFDAILGCSIGGVIGALHACAGLHPEEMIDAGRRLTPGALFSVAAAAWGLRARRADAQEDASSPSSRLAGLRAASFDRLHFGIQRFGVLALDLLGMDLVLVHGGPGRPAELALWRAVAATAAIPGIFPPVAARLAGRRRLLVDPGWFTAVPVERAFAPPFGARHVIAVDLSLLSCPRQARRRYWDTLEASCAGRLVILRPDIRGCGTMVARRGDADRLVEAGEGCLTDTHLRTIRSWIAAPIPPAF